jgi:asparagine synthase (glutamine-hydrolysing)
MSVQAGIWGWEGNPVRAESLLEMTHCVAHHGPDGATTWVKGEMGMLYRAFHTTAESRLQQQPLISAAGNMVTLDGRLDNLHELRLELWDCHLSKTPSDVTLAAAAFDRWGLACFAKFAGDWAIAICSPRNRRLVLARDYIGVKPLFYHLSLRQICWCSYLDPLALSGSKFTVCEPYIAGYLAGFPDAHLTPYTEILSVPPGGYVLVERGQSTAHTYWHFDRSARTCYQTDKEYEEHFRHLFRQSVLRRLRADGTVLAGLSGGLDSSSIVCMADEISPGEGAAAATLDTFSFWDRGEPEEDDFCYFTKVEARRGRVGHHAELEATGDSWPIASFSFAAMPGFGERLELKAAMSCVVGQGGYRVLLSGIGGDEFLGQAVNPSLQLSDQLLARRFRETARSLTAWSLATRRPGVGLLLDALLLLLPAFLRSRMTRHARVAPWIHPTFASKHGIAARSLQAVEGSWWWPPSARDAYQTYSTLARQLTYFSSSTLETRYPYLDQALVEFLLSVPLTQLARPGESRSLMRRALKDLLPPEILARRTKASAGRCIALTVRKHRDRLRQVLRSAVSARLGYTEAAALEAAVLATRNGQMPVQVVQLFKAVALEFWLREAMARNVISIQL